MHLDADELLNSNQSLPAFLAAQTGNVVRFSSFEQMQPAKKISGGLFSHVFKGALPDTPKGQRIGRKAYGQFAASLHAGLLSHVEGKYFVRSGIKNLKMTIHAPFIKDTRDRGIDHPDLRLLHLHGGDQKKWLKHAKYRLEHDSYRSH